MKILRSISLIVLAASLLPQLLITGCNKNEINVEHKAAVTGLDPEGLYSLSPRDKKLAFEKLNANLNIIDKHDGMGSGIKSGDVKVHGHFSYKNSAGIYQTTTIEFSAARKDGKTSGTLHIWRTWEDEEAYAFQLLVEVDCIEHRGNEAVISGKLSSVTGATPFTFPVGSRLWINVKDTGTGAVHDQHHTAILMNPSGNTPCKNWGIDYTIWSSPFFGTVQDVAIESDVIMIN